jgi:DNA polymerase-3 subunit chi
LPHGTAKDGFAADQPVWLSEHDENPNGAAFLFLTDGATSARLGDFERCFELFDGNDEAAVAAARARWAALKAQGHTLTYWQQTDAGAWERRG